MPKRQREAKRPKASTQATENKAAATDASTQPMPADGAEDMGPQYRRRGSGAQSSPKTPTQGKAQGPAAGEAPASSSLSSSPAPANGAGNPSQSAEAADGKPRRTHRSNTRHQRRDGDAQAGEQPRRQQESQGRGSGRGPQSQDRPGQGAESQGNEHVDGHRGSRRDLRQESPRGGSQAAARVSPIRSNGRDSEADARHAWHQAFSNSAEGRRRSAAQAVSHAKNQMDISIADAKQKRQPNAFFSVILAILLFAFRLVGAFIRMIWRFLVIMAVTLVAIGMIGLIGAGYLYATTLAEIPQLENFSLIAMPQDSTIYDRDGDVIGVISTSKREPVAFNQITQSVKDAVVSIEDARFYNHEGVDFIGIARALLANFQSWAGGGGIAQGASTITQQYVRNAYQNVGNDQSVKRKMTEMMLAAQIEAQMSKDEILNSYLNTIYYGNGCYGVQAASQYYFGKSVSDVDYYEAAVLAAIINGPTVYNPATDEGRTQTASRANLILDKMYALGKLGDLTQDDLRALKQTDINERIHITEKERVINHPFYYDYVMRELYEDYPEEQIVSGGWQIYTTLSIKDADAATKVAQGVEEAYDGSGATAVIVDMNVSDGSVNAFCGGTNYDVSQYNAAVDGRLQNGSTLKPFLYATMVDKLGYFTTDLVNCDPIDIAGEGEKEHVITSYLKGGMHTIEEGIIQSDNAMAIRCAEITGMDRIDQMMKACGAKHDLENNLVAIIGGSEMGYTPLEMATVYATLANEGVARETWCIKSITDTYGNTVYEHEDEGTKAMEPETARQITHCMEEAIKQRGDWYDFPFAREGWHVAAKSGTTDDRSDLWCCAFDHNRAAVIWLGGRDAKIEMPTTTPTAVRRLSDYFYAVGRGDSKDEFKQPDYKTAVPSPEEGENSDGYAKRLKEHHLQARMSYVADEERPEGEIVSVTDEGKLVSRNTEVKVTVVRNKIEVPDFVAMGDPGQAYEASNGLTLLFTVRYATSGRATPTITSQSIKPGESVDHGTSVTLEVSVATPLIEQSETQVPYRGSDDLVAKLHQDRVNLTAENDDLKAQIEELSDELTKLEDELIDEQNRTAEESSSGKVTIPNVRGLTVREARQVFASLGITGTASGSSDADIVTSTSPAIGSNVGTGSSIRINTQKSSSGDSGSGSGSGSRSNSGTGGNSSNAGNGADTGDDDTDE